jgi:hypothetical protein
MRRLVVVIFACAMGLGGVAEADYMTAGDIRKYAEADARFQQSKEPSMQDAHEAGVVRGYVAGVQDAFNGKLFCVHDDVSLSQAVAVVGKYLKERPEQWHRPGAKGVVDALALAFPCKR